MIRALRRAAASPGCATELFDSRARALLAAIGRDPAPTSPFSSTSTTSTTPSKISSTDLVAPEPGVVRIDAYDADSFELTVAGGGEKGKGGRRQRVWGPLVVSAPGGFVARWNPGNGPSPSAHRGGNPRGDDASQEGASSPDHYSRISGSVSAIAALVSPRPDIVLVGTGSKGTSPPSSSSPVAAMREISEAAGGAAVEMYPTPQAASLYNVLSQEGRSVLAALLPAGVPL